MSLPGWPEVGWLEPAVHHLAVVAVQPFPPLFLGVGAEYRIWPARGRRGAGDRGDVAGHVTRHRGVQQPGPYRLVEFPGQAPARGDDLCIFSALII